MSSSSAQQMRVSVVVFRSEPLDYQKWRHTALCFRPDNGEPIMIHVIGPPQEYKMEARDRYEPNHSESLKLAGEVVVARLGRVVTKSEIRSILREGAPTRNRDPEFNCQVWVGDALRALENAQLITREERSRGISGMIDITMEAGDG